MGGPTISGLVHLWGHCPASTFHLSCKTLATAACCCFSAKSPGHPAPIYFRQSIITNTVTFHEQKTSTILLNSYLKSKSVSTGAREDGGLNHETIMPGDEDDSRFVGLASSVPSHFERLGVVGHPIAYRSICQHTENRKRAGWCEGRRCGDLR